MIQFIIERGPSWAPVDVEVVPQPGLARLRALEWHSPLASVRMYRAAGTRRKREIATPMDVEWVATSNGLSLHLYGHGVPCAGGDCEGGYDDDGQGVRYCYRHEHLAESAERLARMRARRDP